MSQNSKQGQSPLIAAFATRPKTIEFLGSLCAASSVVMATFPIHKIVFRQSINQLTFQAAVRQIRIEGGRYLYRGSGPMLINQWLGSTATYFADYQWFDERNQMERERRLQNRKAFTTALFNTVADGLGTPLQRVQVILEDGHFNNTYRNMLDVFHSLRPLGAREFYRGTTAGLLQTFPATYIFFAFKDTVRDILLPLPAEMTRPSLRIEMARSFIGGACYGSLLSCLFFPLKVTRLRMQTQTIGSRLLPLSETWQRVWSERRIALKGIKTNAARAAIFWGSVSAGDVWIDNFLLHLHNSSTRH